MHSCCSGLSCLTAVSRATLVMWSTTADSASLRAAVLAVGVQDVAGGDLQPYRPDLKWSATGCGDGDQPRAQVPALHR